MSEKIKVGDFVRPKNSDHKFSMRVEHIRYDKGQKIAICDLLGALNLSDVESSHDKVKEKHPLSSLEKCGEILGVFHNLNGVDEHIDLTPPTARDKIASEIKVGDKVRCKYEDGEMTVTEIWGDVATCDWPAQDCEQDFDLCDLEKCK